MVKINNEHNSNDKYLNLLEIVNEDNLPSGLTKTRQAIHQDKDWHRTTTIYIVHLNHGILCHQRASNVDYFANKWQPYVGGHIVYPETPIENAIKEIREEIGLQISPFELKPGPLRKEDDSKEWKYTFIFNYSGKIENFQFLDKEVAQTTFLTYDRIIDSMKREPDRWASRPSSMEIMKSYLK